MKKWLRTTVYPIVLLLTLWLTTTSAFAVDRSWNNAAGGDFNTATNWTPNGVPGPSDNASITLAGTYTVTMSGTRIIAGLTLGGASGVQTLDTNSQALTLSAASTVTATTGVLANSGTLTLNGALTVNGTLTNTGTVSSNTGTLTVNGILNLSGGTLSGASAQTIASGGILNWISGTILGTSTAQTTTIASGATLNINIPSITVVLDKRSLTNNGTVNWTGAGNIQADNGAIFNNESGGVFNATFAGGDSIFYWSGAGANPAFNNKAGATLHKATGSGILYFQDTNFSNNGTVESLAGTVALAHISLAGATGGTSTGVFNTTSPGAITFSGTPHTLNGASFTGTGTSSITAGTVSAGAGGATVAGGATFNLSGGTLTGAGNFQVNGTMNWTGGTMSGTVATQTTTIAGGATLNINIPSITVVLDKRSLTNNGTVNWTGAGNIQADNGAIFNNESGGVFNATFAGGDSIFYWSGAGANPAFNNKAGATLHKATGSGILYFQDTNFSNNGTVESLAGTVALAHISLAGATGGTSAGVFNTTAPGAITFSGTPHTLNGASFTGTGTSSIISSTVTLGASGATVASGANFTLGGGTLTGAGNFQVNGTMNWTGGIMSGTSTAQTTTIASGATLNINIPSITVGLDKRSLTNNGTVNWTGAGNIQADNGATFNNESGGLVDATFASGDSVFYWSGAGANPVFNNKTGSTLRKRTGSGILYLQDTNFSNNGTVDLQSGTIALNASNGGGSFSNLSGTTLTGGTYLITGNLRIPGDITTNAANLTLNTSTATVTNINTALNALTGFNTNTAAGSLTLTGNKTLTIPGATGNFNNAGTVTLGTSSVLSILGTGNNYVQSGGTTDLTGGTLTTTATGNVNINGGSLIGDGTINSTVSNGGTVAPGHSAGKITIGTNYTQSGALNIEIGGTNAATPDYDQLAVTGTVTLGGSLNLSVINLFSPLQGNVFTIISNSGADAVVGTFSGLPQGSLITTGGKKFRISYTGGDGNDVTLTAIIQVSISDQFITEGNSASLNVTFTVSLDRASAAAVTLNYATANGTTNPATAGADYTAAVSTPLTFAIGETSKTISIPILGDLLDEFNETFFVNLSGLSGAEFLDAQGLGTITDNDALPSIAISDVTVTEGNSGTANATLNVTLSAASGRAVTVQYATGTPGSNPAAPGTDYVAQSLTTLTFNPGETSKPVTVVVTGDLLDEVDERFVVNLSNATNSTIADNQGFGTITDDDSVPTLSINDVILTEGNAGTIAANFTVTLSSASGKTVTVQYNTATPGTNPATAGADYLAVATTTLTFLPGETTKTVTALVNGDVLDEDFERFTMNLKSAGNATITDKEGFCTINDDDAPPSISINDVSQSEGNSGTTAYVFTVTLSAVSGKTVSVKYQTANPGSLIATAGVDYTAVPLTTLTFAPGETNKQITVLVNGDTTVEGTERFAVKLSAQVNSTIADTEGLGSITNDDAGPLLAPFEDEPSE